MKPPCILTRAALISFALFAPVLRLEADPVIEPITPGELLDLLPPHPEGWKVTQSLSQKTLSSMNTPEVSASRKYEVPLDDDGHITTFSLDVVDMGSRTLIVEHLRQSIEKQILEKKPGIEAFETGPISGVIRQREGRDPAFQGTTGPRLIIRATATNVDAQVFKKLLQALDWSRLALAANRLPARQNDSNRFVVGRIDELNAEVNRSTIITVFEPPADFVPPAPEPLPPPPQNLAP
jgi:hypothetical protein